MTPQMTILIVVLAIALLAIMWLAGRRKRSADLRDQFGDEYDHTVREFGDRRQAESELEARRKRVEAFDIRPLSGQDQQRFASEWKTTQAHFVDDPNAAIGEADRLVRDLMQTRGYPMGDFEQRAADISVNHPNVVTNYRAAHSIALDNERGAADTEALRQAMVHYKALFEELLEQRVITLPVDQEDRHARAS